MSAIKHLHAKTVYIPRNSKTNKKRKFAIIGFKNQENLQKALSAHVELFGLKTWWSTKDNIHILNKKKQEDYAQTKPNKKNGNTKTNKNTSRKSMEFMQERKQNKKDKGKAKEEFTEQDFPQSENTPNTNRYSKKPRKTHTYTPPTETTLSSITSVLHNIAKRLDKLEEKEKRSRTPNRS
jgi:RNA recognition motif-containing protein